MTLLIFAFALLVLLLLIRVLIPLGLLLFIPSHQTSVHAVVFLANVRLGEKTVDLGAGDGRVVIAFAQKGAEAHGFEINPFLVLKARRAIRRAGMNGKAFIHWGNFFYHDLSSYDVITIFISPMVMKLLEKKLKRELKKDGKIISLRFPFPHWSCTDQKGEQYLYTKNQ